MSTHGKWGREMRARYIDGKCKGKDDWSQLKAFHTPGGCYFAAVVKRWPFKLEWTEHIRVNQLPRGNLIFTSHWRRAIFKGERAKGVQRHTSLGAQEREPSAQQQTCQVRGWKILGDKKKLGRQKGFTTEGAQNDRELNGWLQWYEEEEIKEDDARIYWILPTINS